MRTPPTQPAQGNRSDGKCAFVPVSCDQSRDFASLQVYSKHAIPARAVASRAAYARPVAGGVGSPVAGCDEAGGRRRGEILRCAQADRWGGARGATRWREEGTSRGRAGTRRDEEGRGGTRRGRGGDEEGRATALPFVVPSPKRSAAQWTEKPCGGITYPYCHPERSRGISVPLPTRVLLGNEVRDLIARRHEYEGWVWGLDPHSHSRRRQPEDTPCPHPSTGTPRRTVSAFSAPPRAQGPLQLASTAVRVVGWQPQEESPWTTPNWQPWRPASPRG